MNISFVSEKTDSDKAEFVTDIYLNGQHVGLIAVTGSEGDVTDFWGIFLRGEAHSGPFKHAKSFPRNYHSLEEVKETAVFILENRVRDMLAFLTGFHIIPEGIQPRDVRPVLERRPELLEDIEAAKQEIMQEFKSRGLAEPVFELEQEVRHGSPIEDGITLTINTPVHVPGLYEILKPFSLKWGEALYNRNKDIMFFILPGQTIG